MTAEHVLRERRRRSRTKIHRALVGLAVLVLAQCLAACGGSGSSQTATAGSGGDGPKGTLTIGVATGGGIDPIPSVGGNCTIVITGHCELWNQSAVEFNAAGKLTPGLATEWRFVGSGNRAFEFVLRHDARFSDGTPVTAQAMKTWINYYTHAPGALALGQLGKITSIETPDRWTVRINMAQPNPALPYGLDIVGAQSPKCVATPAKLKTHTCGAGPYMLDTAQTVPDDHYTFVPNPYYWDKDSVRFSKVVTKVITTPSAMLQALRTGQIQAAQGDATTYDAAKAAGLVITPLPTVQHLYGWDVAGKKSKPLGDLRVRQALEYAIDRKAIADAFGGPGSTPLSEFLTGDGVNPDYIDYYDYDPAKAKKLLADAGYPNGFTIDDADITAYGGDGASVIPITQAVAKYFAAVGVKLQYKPYATFGGWIAKITSDPAPLISDVSPPATYPMWGSWVNSIMPGSVVNRIGGTGWNDPTLTRLMTQGSIARDPTPYWKAAAARMTTQAHYLFTVRTPVYVYATKDIGGITGPVYALVPDVYMK